MDLDSGQRERSFDMALPDLGDPDSNFALGWWILSRLGLSKGSSSDGGGDPGLAKWTVHDAGGAGRTQFLPLEEEDGFYVHVEGHESEPHQAEVHFTGKLLDGTVLASSKQNNPLTFSLAREDVMEGFRLAITSMQAGEKAIFIIPEAWTVTRSGRPATIPCRVPLNQTLRFDIELISLITDIFGDQGVMKKTIKCGTGDKLPLDQDEVLVKYNAYLEDGASISKSEGVEFSLAEGFFLSAFAHVVKTMTKGEEAIVIINPEYGFGEQGRPSMGNEIVVPPNATLYVNLQLISWKTVIHIGDNKKIVKKILCEGYGKQPRRGDFLGVRLIGKLQDGTVFYQRGHNGDDPFTFIIDEERVEHEGLDKVVMRMIEGEVASFTIPPPHAFSVVGSDGSDQYPLVVAPPNSVVIYEIELLSVSRFMSKAASAVRKKYTHSGRTIFIPPFARPEANASEGISTAPGTVSRQWPVTPPAASPVLAVVATTGQQPTGMEAREPADRAGPAKAPPT